MCDLGADISEMYVSLCTPGCISQNVGVQPKQLRRSSMSCPHSRLPRIPPIGVIAQQGRGHSCQRSELEGLLLPGTTLITRAYMHPDLVVGRQGQGGGQQGTPAKVRLWHAYPTLSNNIMAPVHRL